MIDDLQDYEWKPIKTDEELAVVNMDRDVMYITETDNGYQVKLDRQYYRPEEEDLLETAQTWTEAREALERETGGTQL